MTPIEPKRLGGGHWWAHRANREWPARLAAGVIEPRHGYRFRPENLALALMLDGVRAETVVDLGAGTGSLLLIAAYFAEPRACVGVERQTEVVDRLERTLHAHEDVPACVVGDDLRSTAARGAVRDALAGEADLVVMNPPYFPSGWGRSSAQESTRLSTHEEFGGLDDFLDAAVSVSKASARVLVVFDAGRLARLLRSAGAHGFEPRRLLFIDDQRSDRTGEPFRVWVELVRGANRGCAIEWLDRFG